MVTGHLRTNLDSLKQKLIDNFKPDPANENSKITIKIDDMPIIKNIFPNRSILRFKHKHRQFENTNKKFGSLFADQIKPLLEESHRRKCQDGITLFESLYILDFNESYCEQIGSVMDMLLPKRRGKLTDANLERECKLAINSPKSFGSEGLRMVESIENFPKVYTRSHWSNRKVAKSFETLDKNTVERGLF